MSDQNPPKLIVDDDWKSEAKREKEKLSAKPAEQEAGKDDPRNRPLEFTDMVRTFASQAAVYLGLIPEPQSQQRIYSPEMAKLNIDFLAILEDKTKGNLSETEQEELTQTVAELRSLFVETSKAVAQAMEEGKIGQQPGGESGAGGIPDLRMPND